jgi:hypothetical protein
MMILGFVLMEVRFLRLLWLRVQSRDGLKKEANY